jgi:hypothetical protein
MQWTNLVLEFWCIWTTNYIKVNMQTQCLFFFFLKADSMQIFKTVLGFKDAILSSLKEES